ncbi:MAG: glycosyltransferase [Balneolaceae bacterium]
MITILIPTTRRSRLLRRTLDSLATCRASNGIRELVVVENGPRGDSEEIVRSVEQPFPVRFLHLERANKSHALNHVIESLPSDEWVLFLDDDVRLHEQTLQAYARALKTGRESPEPRQLYFGGPVGVDRESDPPEWMEPLLPLSARGADLKNSRPALGYLGCNWMVQAGAIQQRGGFNESLGPGAPGGASGQESEMMHRLEEAGYAPVDVSGAWVWHYVPADRTSEEWLNRRFENYGASLARSERGLNPGRARRELLKYTVRYSVYALLRNRLERKRSELEMRTRRAYLREKREQDTRPVLAFLYYSYYPIRGGASLHGAQLARGLHKREYRLVKLNGEPDPWSERWPATPWHAAKLLLKAERVYARADYFLNSRNLLTALALLFGKRVVLELNSPSDELRLKGAGERRIRWTDRIAGVLLRRACRIVVVSEAVERYAREALGIDKTQIVANGGELVPPPSEHREDPDTNELRETLDPFIQTYPVLALWTGTPTGLQSIDWAREMARRCPEVGIVMAVNEEPGTEEVLASEENVCILRNRSRKEIEWLIARASIGLAFYEPMPWSRWGFYLSPLKIPEFLNSGLHVITNAPGSPAQRVCPGFHEVTCPEEAAGVIRTLMSDPESLEKTPNWPPVRTWDEVADETDQILKTC